MHYKVGTPYNVKHSIHVDFNSATGFQVPFLSPLCFIKRQRRPFAHFAQQKNNLSSRNRVCQKSGR